MEHLKQLYGAAALGVAAVLFAGISGTEVMAQELENAADKAAQGAFEYLYLEERGSSDTNEMKIVIQLSYSEEAPASAQLQFHYEGDSESEIVDASQIAERTVTFTQGFDDATKTAVLDTISWTENDTVYTVDFAENQIEIAGNDEQTENANTALLYLADGTQKEVPVSEEPIRIEEMQEAVAQPEVDEAIAKEDAQEETDRDSYTGGELFTDVKKENWFYPAVSLSLIHI